MNATTLCGRNNWRLPHKEELSGIVARDRYTPNPTIDSDFFANTLASHNYWTASPAYNSGNNSTLAWVVYFSYGYEGLLSKNTARSVRLVSGDVLHAGETLSGCQTSIYASKVDAIYNDHGDGTVTDTQTGLMWAKCPLGLSDAACATGTATTANWKQALEAAQTANDDEFLGYDDWRLPSTAELRTLAEPACPGPAINRTMFPNTGSTYYRSASPYANIGYSAWVVNFGAGFEINDSKSSSYRVRLVRGGL